eukprot:scaffold4523_cov264-Prasinococcus_capsulatus_cf.AAC.1
MGGPNRRPSENRAPGSVTRAPREGGENSSIMDQCIYIYIPVFQYPRVGPVHGYKRFIRPAPRFCGAWDIP